MTPKISVVIPYLSGGPSVALCRRQLKENSVSPFETIEIADSPNVYQAYNDGARKAKGDILVMLHDDMFVAPGWDLLIPEATKERTIVTTYLVESGLQQVNYRNIHQDFGRSVDQFQRPAFEKFVTEYAAGVPGTRTGLGWYTPMAVRREDYVPFPREDPSIPCDVLLFGIFASKHYQFVQVKSFAYHLQEPVR